MFVDYNPKYNQFDDLLVTVEKGVGKSILFTFNYPERYCVTVLNVLFSDRIVEETRYLRKVEIVYGFTLYAIPLLVLIGSQDYIFRDDNISFG